MKPVTPENMAKLQQQAMLIIETDALGGLHRATTSINEALGNLEKSKGNPTLPTHQANLKALEDRVHLLMEYLENCILAHSNDKGGFKNDPTGLFEGNSQWSKSEKLNKKYSFSHLVDVHAKKWKEKKRIDEEALAKGELISSTSAAEALNSTEDVVELTLNNGDTVLLDRKENLIGEKDPETGKISWYKSSYNLTKDWIGSVCSYIKNWGADIWKWLVSKYQQCVNFFYGDDEVKA